MVPMGRTLPAETPRRKAMPMPPAAPESPKKLFRRVVSFAGTGRKPDVMPVPGKSVSTRTCVKSVMPGSAGAK